MARPVSLHRPFAWLVLLAPLILLAGQAKPVAATNCTFRSRPAAGSERERWREISGMSESVSRGRAARPGVSTSIQHRNFIDDEIFGTMSRDGIKPTALSTDEEFLRRASLALTGQTPLADEVRAFLADAAPEKRSRKINELLASDAYADRWTVWYGDLVQNVQFSTFSRQGPQARNAFYRWIRDSFRAGKPYDQIVRETLAGRGDNFLEGPANYIVRQLQPNGPIQDTYDNLSAHSGERFLALPMNCLSCHDGLRHLESVNSFLSGRKRAEFWSNAAFFARTTARQVPDPANNNLRHVLVADNPAGEYRLNTISGNKTPRQPPTGQPNFVSPAFFLSGQKPAETENWREAYGRFLTADRQFARATVNLIWREMFGLALVEPVDSMDLLRIDPAKLPPGATLQTLHPALLERLTDSFRASGYDFRALLRLMGESSAWQLSTSYTPAAWNENWTPYFARRYARRLAAEAVLDAIFRATGVDAELGVTESTPVRRAMQLPDPTEPNGRGPFRLFLNSFGRGDRDDTLRTDESSITQALALLNDGILTTRIRQSAAGSTVQRLLASTGDPAQVAEGLYLATLSRKPDAVESARAIEHLRSGDLARKTEDLQYVLLNSLEFIFN